MLCASHNMPVRPNNILRNWCNALWKTITVFLNEQHGAWAGLQKWSPPWSPPYIGDLVAQLQNKQAHPAVTRNAVRILQEIELPEAFHGEVMNTCFTFIETPSTPVAIKAFSLTTLFKLSRQYTEIRSELKMIIEERWETETAAFRVRGKKILAALS